MYVRNYVDTESKPPPMTVQGSLKGGGRGAGRRQQTYPLELGLMTGVLARPSHIIANHRRIDPFTHAPKSSIILSITPLKNHPGYWYAFGMPVINPPTPPPHHPLLYAYRSLEGSK